MFLAKLPERVHESCLSEYETRGFFVNLLLVSKIKRMKRLCFFALVALSTACKKDPIQYTFSGNVDESASNSNLSGCEVDLKQKLYDGTVASNFYSTAGSFTTGSDGNYEISFEREKVVDFKITFSKDGYFTEEQIIQSADVSTEEPKVVNETLDPKSWLTFHLVNIGGLTTDEFTMIHYNFRTGCEGCTINDYFYYNGIIDTTFTITTTGGVYAKYARNNPGSATWTTDSAFMTPFDTVLVNINY